MDLSTGQKLSKARLAKGLSVDEVAHATKLRPDKVLALEHDDYSRFPNNAYVKGFLQIYGRFLSVDVRAAMAELENPSPVSISDYQYLNSVPEKEPERFTMRRRTGKPSLVPLVVFLILCVIVSGGGYLYINAKRLGDLERVSAAESSAPEVVAAPAEKPAPSPAPKPETQPPVAEKTADVIEPETPPVAPAETNDVAANTSAADHEFIEQKETPPAPETPSVINEVLIEPVRKTWVTVRTGDRASTPVFEDFLYTNAPPLRLHGPHFLIEVRDEGAVVIRKNGAPIAYEGSGVTIQ